MIVYASDKDTDPDAADESAETMYEMGEDFGTILKYVLDFHIEMNVERSEFDVMGWTLYYKFVLVNMYYN